MLALATTDAVYVATPSGLKNPPSSLSSAFTLSGPPSAAAWSSDHKDLIFAQEHTVNSYNVTTKTSQTIYVAPSDSAPISCLVAATSCTSFVFSAGEKVHLCEKLTGQCAITHTWDVHSSTITSMSLSADGQHLATTSTGDVKILDLSNTSRTPITIRGLSGPSVVCAFHAHTQATLLLGMGSQLVVYDTTRPTAPTKTIKTGLATDVVHVACSPFSKTLVAVADHEGTLSLLDLEKHKSVVRTLSTGAHLTSLAFSPEGSALYLGTARGTLLIQSLRELDKPPKVVLLGGSGCRVQALCVQRKMKVSAGSQVTEVPNAARKSSAANSPRRTSSAGTKASLATPVRALSGKAKLSPSPRTFASSAARSPLARPPRPSVETLGRLAAKERPTPTRSARYAGLGIAAAGKTVPPPRDWSAAQGTSPRLHDRQRTALNAANALAGSSPSLSPSVRKRIPALDVGNRHNTTRSRQAALGLGMPTAVAEERRIPSSGTSTSGTDSSAPSRFAESSSSRATTPANIGSIPALFHFDGRAGAPASELASGADVVAPLPVKGKARAVATTDVEADSELSDDGGLTRSAPSTDDEDLGREGPGHADLTIQVAPLPRATRALAPPLEVPGIHDVLRAAVQDAMYDIRREAKADALGLHLDIVRLGRTWRRELHEAVGGLAEDLRLLQEECTTLRAENERLRRRGY